jgi:hypothetical protein
METPRAQHSNRHSRKDSSHNEVWRDAFRHDVLIAGFGLGHDDFQELFWGSLGGFDPASYREPYQEAGVEGEEAQGEGFREEGILGDEAPVYGPFVEKGAGKVEGAGEVGD